MVASTLISGLSLGVEFVRPSLSDLDSVPQSTRCFDEKADQKPSAHSRQQCRNGLLLDAVLSFRPSNSLDSSASYHTHMLTLLPATESRGVSSGPLVRPLSRSLDLWCNLTWNESLEGFSGPSESGSLGLHLRGNQEDGDKANQTLSNVYPEALGTKAMWTSQRGLLSTVRSR